MTAISYMIEFFVIEKFCYFVYISPKFVPKSPIKNNPLFV